MMFEHRFFRYININANLLMRYLITLYVLLLLCVTATNAQLRQNTQYLSYINKYKDIAIEQMHQHHIPASITLAQGLLESGAGQSTLARNGNNHFGIKCHDWSGRRMYKDDDAKNDCFRVYSSARDSYEDHSLFLKKKRYASLFTLPITDYKGWARGLKQCGYATSPTYATQLISIIELYNLQQYDKAKSYDKHSALAVGNGKLPYINTEYPVQYCNKNHYVIAHRGDTYATIGAIYGISARKLAKYNERDKKTVLQEGERVYLEKKRKYADKQFKRIPHIVRSGESLYDIAQMYGMRLKYLYKKNKLDANYVPRVGDKLVVY